MFRFSDEIHVVTVGKMRTKHWLTAQDDYLKRLKRYGDVRLTEVKDSFGRGFLLDVAKQREGEQLLKASAHASRRILLTPNGKLLSSKGLSQFLYKNVVHYGRLAFLIGGPIGFSDEVVEASHAQISLSPMTFTHEMARVIWLEQLYRACTILNNEKYHK